MAEVMVYAVRVMREGDAWLAEVDEVPGAHTYARSLASLDRHVRDAIVLAADLPDEEAHKLHLDYRYEIADLDDVAKVAARRRNLAAAEDRLAQHTADAVRNLLDQGYSVRDIAVVVGLTPGRVSQIASTSQHPRSRRRISA